MKKPSKKPVPIVTKESLKDMLSHPDRRFREAVIGHALVALLERQSAEERITFTTSVHNSRGFSQADAKVGMVVATHYKKHRELKYWMIKNWTREDKTGYPRLTKYWKQLNEVALEKAAKE